MINVTSRQQYSGTKHYVYNSKVYDTSHTPKHNDINTSYRTLYKYLQSNGYVTYEGRGQSSRWAYQNAKVSTNIVHDLVIIDLTKLWTMRTLTNKHPNTMRRIAHKIKVIDMRLNALKANISAFKSTRRAGDKQMAYGK